AELLRLLLDRRDELRVLVPDRDVDELRREIEVALAVEVPEVAALTACHRDRVERVLHRPRVQDVALRVLDHLPAELGVGLDDRHGESLRELRWDAAWRLADDDCDLPLVRELDRLRLALERLPVHVDLRLRRQLDAPFGEELPKAIEPILPRLGVEDPV